MAITKYYPRFRARSLAFALIMQAIVGVLMGGWFLYADIFGVTSDNYLLAVVAPFILFEAIATALTVVVATEPAKIITEAVAQATKQAGNTPPPNITHRKYKRNGIQAIVKAIYELGTPKVPEVKPETAGRELLAETIDHLPVGVILLNSEHRIVYRNSKAPLRENAVDIFDINLFFNDDNSLVKWLQNSEKNEIKSHKTWARITSQSPDDSNRQFYDILASYNKNGVDDIETMIITIDRTAEYQPDEEAMDFIALAAHELRGPITVIHGYLDVLADELHDQLDDDYRALLERLTVSSSRLSGYVNNILNASRFDRRHLKLHLAEAKLQDVYHPIDEDLQMRARTQNRLLSIHIPNDLPTVAADKTSVGEVITNLVDNAIKYSNEGGQVIVNAKVEGNFVKVSVEDKGIGMPGSVVQKLFTKFYRSHRSRETVAGTGLGLYISKAIIESHGGKMSVSSQEGQGSTLAFTLPIYSTVADKLLASNNKNEAIIESSNGWIKNHAMYRG